MGRIIALVNQKGGVGKTTSTINIGAALAARKKKVLLVDLDPQASLTIALGAKGAAPTVYDVLKGRAGIGAAVLAHGAYRLVPSGPDLSGAELEIASVAGRECILKEALEAVEKDYDFILIDCPPSLSLLTLNALVAAGEIFVILQTEFLALEGMSQLLDTVDLVKKRLNSQLRLGGIVATQHDKRKGLHREVLESIKKHFPQAVFKTAVRNAVALAEAASFGRDIFEYRPKSAGAEDYANLAKEILNRR
ncbi:chromosome partitioning protein ParA (plasmid) [Deltaproteobacteria bacterium Smac51]|nr:chromosome partitioning protein ParA [Deltaproteobacteria bacterium Smac51]